jgi:pentatricopeptide repeat protein
MKKIFTGLLIISVLSSCVTSSVVLDVQRPADITVSQDIQNVVIVNRSRPSKENLTNNIVEGLISGEGIGYDRKGAEYCIEGLSNMLLKSERYTLKNTGGMELKGTGTAAFPIPLDWNEVISICGSYDGDALLVLETFDSDSRTIVGKPIARTRKRKGVKVKELRYPATLIMEIQSGWRIYDVKNRNIVDENRFTEVKEFKAYGSSHDDAIRHLLSKSSAIKESGIFAGQQYGFRISPMWVKVRRTYFTGKHDDLKMAKSYVKHGDWDAAIEIWKDLVNNSDKKIARRSTYNMAIASEIKGGLDTAIEWAHKAKKLGEKKAHNYINVLHIRKMNEEKLKQQLNN